MQLSKNKTDYLFDHLRQHWVPDKRVMDAFAIFQPGEPVPEGIQGKIVFQLSDREEPQPLSIDFEERGFPFFFRFRMMLLFFDWMGPEIYGLPTIICRLLFIYCRVFRNSEEGSGMYTAVSVLLEAYKPSMGLFQSLLSTTTLSFC